MKKLILLLFIPLVFACSASNEERGKIIKVESENISIEDLSVDFFTLGNKRHYCSGSIGFKNNNGDINLNFTKTNDRYAIVLTTKDTEKIHKRLTATLSDGSIISFERASVTDCEYQSCFSFYLLTDDDFWKLREYDIITVRCIISQHNTVNTKYETRVATIDTAKIGIGYGTSFELKRFLEKTKNWY